MIDELTATLTATRSIISPSTKIITHDHPPDTDRDGPSRTLRMCLRIRRLGVRIPPGAPLSPLVSALSCAHASIRARCRRALGAIVGAIGLQQHLGHPGCGCALLAFYEMPVHVFCDGDARVSDNLRDHIEIGALGQHQRRS